MNLIYQYYVGREVPEFAKISRFSFTEYADKYGHEYLFSEKRFLPEQKSESLEYGCRYFDITRIYMDPFFDDYDYVLFADCDVIAHLRSPDIFDFKPKHIAGWSEQKHPQGNTGPGYSKGTENFSQIESSFKDFGAPLIDSTSKHSPTRILNSGVLIFSKEARILAREKFDDWKLWYERDYPLWITLDQLYLSAMFNKYEFDVLEIDNRWNYTPSWFSRDKQIDSFLYHFSGIGKNEMNSFFTKEFEELN